GLPRLEGRSRNRHPLPPRPRRRLIPHPEPSMTASTADFIEVFPAALDAGTCAAIVERMRASDALQAGRVGSGVFPELKKSRDISLPGRAEWADVEQALNVAVYGGLLAYLRRYPQALIAPLMLQQPGPDGALRRLDAG